MRRAVLSEISWQSQSYRADESGRDEAKNATESRNEQGVRVADRLSLTAELGPVDCNERLDRHRRCPGDGFDNIVRSSEQSFLKV